MSFKDHSHFYQQVTNVLKQGESPLIEYAFTWHFIIQPHALNIDAIYIIFWFRLSVCLYVCMYVCMSVCYGHIAQKLLDGFSKFKRHMFMYGPQ